MSVAGALRNLIKTSPMSPDVLARVRAEIDERLAQLRPAAEEHRRLLAAADALGLDIDAPAGAGGAAGARRGRRRGSPVAAPSAARGRAAGGRRRAPAAGAVARASSARHPAAEQAIVAALEHGSHTVAELVVVTAMAGGEIRASLRRLQGAGTVTRTRREGRTAYTLSPSA